MDRRVEQFWALVQASQLLTAARCEQWKGRFAETHGESPNCEPRVIAEWLIAQRVVSRYQAQQLLAGRPGPFNFGPYRVYEKTRDGTFRALHIPTQHPVQLIFAPLGLRDSPGVWEAWQHAAELHSEIDSLTLSRCYHVGEEGQYRFAVIEDSTSPSLRHILGSPKHRSLQPSQACLVIHDLAQALSALHERQLIHGLWQPSHVRIDSFGRAKLMQDPFAKFTPVDWSGEDSTWDIRVDYAAPELANQRQPLDPLTDIYALGCLAYQMIAGEVPYRGASVVFKLAAHATQRPKPFAISVSDPLNEIIHFMMAKRRELRIASCADVLALIAEVPEFPPASHPPLGPSATWSSYQQYLASLDRNPLVVPSHENVTLDSRHAEETPSVTHRFRPAHRIRSSAIIAGAALVLLAALPVLLHWTNRPRHVQAPPTASSNGASDPAAQLRPTTPRETVSQPPADGSGGPATSTQPALELIADDTRTLWTSPTAGPPIDLRFTPQGAQMILAVRLADMLATDEGPRMIDALGPLLAEHRQAWHEQTGIAWESIDSCLIAYLPDADQSPQMVSIVRLIEGQMIGSKDKWGTATSTPLGQLFRTGDEAILIPANENDRIMVRGPFKVLEKIVEDQGTSPPLRLDLEKLHLRTDADRWFNLIVAPNFLTGDGRGLFPGKYDQLRLLLQDWARDELRGLFVGAHWDKASGMYLELRMRPRLDVRTKDVADRMRDGIDQLPLRVERYLGEVSTIDPYWGRLALRADNMFRTAVEFTRIEHRNDQVVINVVLPPNAPHNLLLVSELMLVSNQAGGSVGRGNNNVTIVSLDQLLARPISYSIPQQSLEFAIRDLASEVNENVSGLGFKLEIQIVGKDLEAEGITRNQQIRQFSREQVPLADVLTGLVMQANPVTTVKFPSDPDQKLVWLALPSGADGPTRTILITTRAAASRAGHTLPENFRTP